MEYWGQHMLLDCVTTDLSKITSKENIQAFVKKLIEEIDMVAYGPIWIERFATHDPDKAGISFCQMIETSNITGHFVDKDGSFYLDIFSCKDFSPSKVSSLVCEYFNTTVDNIKVRVISRDSRKI